MRKITRFITIFLIFVVVVLTVVFTSRDRLNNYFLSRFYPWTIQGQVTDITNASPLDLAEIDVGGRRTYSISDGTFKLENLKDFSVVKIISPDLYEEYPNPLSCRRDNRLVKNRRLAVCNVSLYPTPENTAGRVEVNLSIVRRENDEELQNRNNALWDLLDPESQKFLSGRSNFVDAMVIYNLIQRKLSLQQIYFKIEAEKEVLLPKWTNKASNYEYLNVMELPVVRADALGRRTAVLDHFIRVDGVWRYIFEMSLLEIKRFNNTYGWALKLKD